MSTPFGQMKAKYGSELTTTLDWARNSLDQESAEVLSADLESDDIAKAEKAFRVVTTCVRTASQLSRRAAEHPMPFT